MDIRYTSMICELDANDKDILLHAINLLRGITKHFDIWQKNENILTIDHNSGFSLEEIIKATTLLLDIVSEGHIEYLGDR